MGPCEHTGGEHNDGIDTWPSTSTRSQSRCTTPQPLTPRRRLAALLGLLTGTLIPGVLRCTLYTYKQTPDCSPLPSELPVHTTRSGSLWKFRLKVKHATSTAVMHVLHGVWRHAHVSHLCDPRGCPHVSARGCIFARISAHPSSGLHVGMILKRYWFSLLGHL